MRSLLLAAAFGAIATADAGAPASVDALARDAQALERVFERHRIWPSDNPAPRPAVEERLPSEAMRERAEDSLRLADALERLWGRPVTAAQLQAELDRIVRSTRQPEVLRELFAALADDPRRIVASLVRPVLVRRLAAEAYAADRGIHAKVRRRAEEAAARAAVPADLRALGAEYVEIVRVPAGSAARFRPGPGAAVALDAEAWAALRSELTRRFDSGPVAPLREDTDAFVLAALLEDGADRVVTASAVWRKEPFSAWWSRVRSEFEADPALPPGEFRAGAPEAGCTDGTWVPTATEVPDPRRGHVAVWTGAEMIVWGGERDVALGNGGRYVPATDSWTPMSRTGAPEARWKHAAVWTGTKMVVWGGFRPTVSLATGGMYDPATDTWTTTATSGAPSSRQEHTAVWTGTEMIVWGGLDQASGARFRTGARFNPATNVWTGSTTTTGAPAARNLHTAVWSGSEMIVFGGNDSSLAYRSDGGRYNPASNAWTAVPASGGNGRTRHTAVWTGTLMLVFGGYDGASSLAAPLRYDLAGNAWSAASTTGAPTPRNRHAAVWTGSEMIVWGGEAGTDRFGDGARYEPVGDAWLPVAADGPSPRSEHTVVWAGSRMLVWGGYDGLDFDVRGGRYEPGPDAWSSMSTGASVPEARYEHTAVWTGSEMIVYGGVNETVVRDAATYVPALDAWTRIEPPESFEGRYLHAAVWSGREMIAFGGYGPAGTLNTGARYDPASESWTATGTGNGVPEARAQFAAVWDGSRLVLWGGTNGATSLSTGGRYDPIGDSWSPTATAGAPVGRRLPTAVWNGSEMIVFGGADDVGYQNTGGRYDPRADAWAPTTTTDAPSPRAWHVAAWTGTRMVVQGGFDGSASQTDGGRYDPAADSWTPVTSGFPARDTHTAVWNGSHVVTFGGYADGTPSAGGARYDPVADTLSNLPASGAPAARAEHTAIWSGERMIVWGGFPATSTGGAFCATPACAATTWYRDFDGDGFGNASDAIPACAAPAGYVAASGDCDDASALAFPGGTEICDGRDNDCDGAVDEEGAPGRVEALVLSKDGPAAVLSWPAVAGASGYDVVRGSLGTLRSSAGDFTAATGGCLANDLAATNVSDPDVPAPGAGSWHLVRAVGCGSGTYDDATAQSGSRDAEIAASAESCP